MPVVAVASATIAALLVNAVSRMYSIVSESVWIRGTRSSTLISRCRMRERTRLHVVGDHRAGDTRTRVDQRFLLQRLLPRDQAGAVGQDDAEVVAVERRVEPARLCEAARTRPSG